MTTTRFVAFDLRSGVQLGEVPLGNVSYTQRLNAEADLTGSVDLAQRLVDGTSLGAYYRDLLTPGKTKLAVVDEDGIADPISFVVWERTYDGERMLTIRCAGIWSYIARYPLNELHSYDDTEQFDIASDLIRWVEDQPSADIHLRIDTTGNSGVNRDGVYNGFEYRPVGEIITELATADDGFEFSIVSSGGVRAVIDTWTPHYPLQGTLFADDPKTIALARFPATLALSEREPATTLTLLGAGEGDDMATASVTAQGLLDDGYPSLPVATAFKTEAAQSTLDARVVGEFDKFLRRRKTWTLAARGDIDRYEWSQIGVGDEVALEVPAGIDYLYPEGLTLLQRVVGRTVTIGADGDETLSFELGDTPSTFTAEAVGTITYRFVGTGDSVLAMSWGFSSPGGVIKTSDRWLDFEHGRAPYTTGLAHRYSTAGIWPLIEAASQPEGWVLVMDNSLGATDEQWEGLLMNIRDELPDNRNLVAVLPGYSSAGPQYATLYPLIAARAATMRTVLSGHPRANFVDLTAYMVSNPSQFPDGQHPDATAQAWIKAAITALTG